jgi:hypothetical protein
VELRGIISDGRLILEDGGTLPEGTRVSVRVTRASAAKPSRPPARDPIFDLARIAVDGGRADLSERHDELAYGEIARRTPPRKPKARTRRKKGRP